MPTIVVEKLTFVFAGDWQASKFDDSTFYVRQFQQVCGKAKAVDVLAIDVKVCLWLIEGKDYRQGQQIKAADLALNVAQKVRDSLAALVAARANATDPQERAFAAEALRCPQLRVVLHMEQPKQHSKLFPRGIDPANVLQHLKQLVKAIDPHPLLTQMARMQNVKWTVS